MFTKTNQSKTSTKSLAVACLVGAVAISSFGYIAQDNLPAMEFEVPEVFTELRGRRSNHHSTAQCHKKTPMEIVSLTYKKDMHISHKVYERLEASEAELKKYAKDEFDFMHKVGPALDSALKVLSANVHWGEKTVDSLADIEAIREAFKDKSVIAKAHKVFPSSARVLQKLTQEMTLHNFNLANAIGDINIMVDATKSNLTSAQRKIALRKKMGDKMTPKQDSKLFAQIVRKQESDIKYQREKTDKVLEKLKIVEKKSMETKNELAEELENIRVQLEEKMKSLGDSASSLDDEIADSKCGFFDAFFTLGTSCVKASKAKMAMQKIQAQFKHELGVAEDLYHKLQYFSKFTHQSPEEKKHCGQVTPPLVASYDKPHKPVAEPNFDPMNSWEPASVDSGPWTNFLAHESVKLGHNSSALNSWTATFDHHFTKAIAQCNRVSKKCDAKKKALDNALIWGK